jgi:enoyl-CoA hydratase/carnithine racemase
MFALSQEAGIARISLNRPEARNAIPLEGWGQLAGAIAEAEAGGARLLVVAGEPGGAFCAGADISSFDSFRDDHEARTEFRLAIRIALDRLLDLPIPTVALVEGACYGAGVALAMACDIRIAGAGAQFATTPAKLGISYPQEDVHRLVSLVGAGQAARLLLGAQSIDSAEAERIGLIEIYSPSGVEEALSAFAAAALANDPASLRTLKRSVRLAAEGVRTDEQQDREFDSLLGSDAVAQRIAAYRSRPR